MATAKKVAKKVVATKEEKVVTKEVIGVPTKKERMAAARGFAK